MRRGVYAVGRSEISGKGRFMAAVLASGHGAALSHGSAADLWGITGELRGITAASASAADVTEVTVPGHRRPRPTGIRIHRRALQDRDITARECIPVTTPTRTLLDLAGRLSSASLEAVINAADTLDLIDPETLRARLDDLPGEYGSAAVRRLLDRRAFALTDSELERRFLRLVRRAGVPMPEAGVPLHGFKLDFLWRDLGLVVETDGLRYHRTPAQQGRDRRRDQALAAAGLTPLRFTHEQVVHHPADVERTLRAVVDRLRAGGGPSSRRTRGRSR